MGSAPINPNTPPPPMDPANLQQGLGAEMDEAAAVRRNRPLDNDDVQVSAFQSELSEAERQELAPGIGEAAITDGILQQGKKKQIPGYEEEDFSQLSSSGEKFAPVYRQGLNTATNAFLGTLESPAHIPQETGRVSGVGQKSLNLSKEQEAGLYAKAWSHLEKHPKLYPQRVTENNMPVFSTETPNAARALEPTRAMMDANRLVEFVLHSQTQAGPIKDLSLFPQATIPGLANRSTDWAHVQSPA